MDIRFQFRQLLAVLCSALANAICKAALRLGNLRFGWAHRQRFLLWQ